ncbi:DUF934 domain-containing protein [Psychrobacter sp.]|uniref:DUF934 domain-containing protein n=1 Tax=Psychrobacter sp. TaxID=56811 RepID=UPI003C717E84
MANHHILDSHGTDISSQDNWHVLTTDALPESIVSTNITLLELLQRQEKPDVIVPLADLLDNSGVQVGGLVKEIYELIVQHSSRLGLWVTADTDADALEGISDFLSTQALIVIDVPKFADGRNFSFAQTLRQLGYEGDIRMAGAFGRDQIAYLLRAGATSFVLNEHDAKSDISQAFTALASSYDGRDASALPMFSKN